MSRRRRHEPDAIERTTRAVYRERLTAFAFGAQESTVGSIPTYIPLALDAPIGRCGFRERDETIVHQPVGYPDEGGICDCGASAWWWAGGTLCMMPTPAFLPWSVEPWLMAEGAD